MWNSRSYTPKTLQWEDTETNQDQRFARQTQTVYTHV